MDIEKHFNTLLQETERRMAAAAAGMEGKETVATCREMVSYLKAKNRELKAYALARPFSGNEEEIRYFKYYKPALTGRLLYYYRVYQIESGCPGCLRVAETYYRRAMERAERMMERYLPFYQYYHSGATYRDNYYFLRAKGELSPESGSFVLDEEAEFSTGYDILAARLISVEMLLVYLSRRIERAARGDGAEAVPGKEHRWTDTKIAAIQLVYGIHAAGSVDNGNAEIGELAADKVVELVKKDGKTYVVINDYQKVRELFGELLAEIQRIKSTGDFEGARSLVENYAVKVDPALHAEVLERYKKLNLAPYKGFVNPKYELVTDENGNVTDVTVSYDEGYVEQMLRYSTDYSPLPSINN